MTDHIAAGYLAVRPAPRPPWHEGDDLPSEIISLSHELCAQMPLLTWVGDWSAEAERFGVTNEVRPWIDAHDGTGILFPNIGTDLSVVQEFTRTYVTGPVKVIGFGLPEEEVPAFLAARPSGDQRDGIIVMLEQGRVLAAGGSLLGYEPCGASLGGIETSWLVHGLPGEMRRAIGTRVNRHGLVAPEDRAAVDEYVQRTPGKEDGTWRTWAVVEYA